MAMFTVHDLFGCRTAASANELRSFLAARAPENDCNHFHIHQEDADYPLLTLFVNGDRAVLHYFSREQDGCFLSLNPAPFADSPTCFHETPTAAPIAFDAEAVIEMATALTAVDEFCATAGQRPSCLAWLEL